jgi:acetokinase family protein
VRWDPAHARAGVFRRTSAPPLDRNFRTGWLRPRSRFLSLHEPCLSRFAISDCARAWGSISVGKAAGFAAQLLHHSQDLRSQFTLLELPPLPCQRRKDPWLRVRVVNVVDCSPSLPPEHLPERTRRLLLRGRLYEEGVRRYGFHGLSYEFIVSEMGNRLGRRAVIAHPGNGASLAALSDGACLVTSMSFTPSGGIVMGTRPGDLDPGVILYLLSRGPEQGRSSSS